MKLKAASHYWPNHVQLVHQSVDERAACSVWAVELKRLGSNDLLRADLADGDLGLLERDDERLVGEDVALGGREEVQPVVAKLLQLDRFYISTTPWPP